ncbi:MAG: hypothetical protein KAI79_03525 [Bacteroidales bacterium]|nr:hypothetical protein [Bacteroidales bacterium]
MNYCNCKDVSWFDVVFGVLVFAIVLVVMGEKLIILYGQTEWYRALGVTLGSITVAGTIGVVGSLSAQWIIQNIVLVIIAISALWLYSLTLV